MSRLLMATVALLLWPSAALLAEETSADSGALQSDAGEAEQAIASARNDQGRVSITGSRIPQDSDRFMRNGRMLTTQPVTVYTREELERTGEMDLRDALRRIDARFY